MDHLFNNNKKILKKKQVCKAVSSIIFITGFLFSSFLFPLTLTAGELLHSDFTGYRPADNTPWIQTSYLSEDISFSGWELGSGAYPSTKAVVNDSFSYYLICYTTNTLAEALVNEQYISFTLEPAASSFSLANKKVNFNLHREDDHSPIYFAVFTSINGFEEGKQLYVGECLKSDFPDVLDFSFIISGSEYENITGPVEIRIYNYGALYAYHDANLIDFNIEDAGPLYTIQADSGPNGSVKIIPDGTTFEEGALIQIEATPEPGYHFTGWTGDITGFGNPRTIMVQSDVTVTALFEENLSEPMHLGMNLGYVRDWTRDKVFVDAFKMFRPWMTRDIDTGGYDSGKSSEVLVDINGYPTEIPFRASDGTSHLVHTIMVAQIEAGEYTLIVEGTGHVKFSLLSEQEFFPTGGTNTYTVNVSPWSPGWALGFAIIESDSNDPIRNIRFIRPGFETSYETEPFQPLYLERLQPFSAIRFMDWGYTNNSPIVSWSERTTKDYYTQSNGVAYEYMGEISNNLNEDVWVCIPHMADDDYIRQMAILLRDTIDPGLKIYVEYSNETWNSVFSQTSYTINQGDALGLDETQWVAGHKFAVLRSIQAWKIFEEEFADDSRFVKVIGTQVAGTTTTNIRVAALNDPSINPDYIMPDALAIAPYFGKVFTPDDIPPIAANYPTVDELIEINAPDSILESQAYVHAQKEIADKQGFQLICYEGGQHYVGVYGAENDETLTGIFHETNRDPRMHDLYLDYLTMLEAEGISMFANFSYISGFSKYGSWGVLEGLDQPIEETPKYQALLTYIGQSQDTVPPELIIPGDLLIEAESVYGTQVYLNATAIDNVDPNPVITNDTPAMFSLGQTIVTFTAADYSGNITTASLTVTVHDTTPPVLTAPMDITLEATGETTFVDIGLATATDIFDVTTTNDTPVEFPLGDTIITWTATDDNGNQATDVQVISVLDVCPNDPEKIIPGECGCGVAETDTDSDGTADCNDQCIHDPAKIAEGACGCGLDDTDTDEDGTADCNDCCPEDPNQWINGAPVAVSGNQSVNFGTLVTLDAGESHDPEQNYPLTYSWSFESIPAGSTTALSDPNVMDPSFTADMLGDYIVQLVVTDSYGMESTPVQVQVSTFNTAPVAHAGQDQSIIQIDTIVQLDGTQSDDTNGDTIYYQWTIISKPAGSMAMLNDSSSSIPTFLADVNGNYKIELIVNDSLDSSAPDIVIISFNNLAPVADAGINQSVVQGDTVIVDGSGSHDANLDTVTYSWAIVSRPEASNTEIEDPSAVQASLVVDQPGEYVLSLIVNDGLLYSEASNINIVAISYHDLISIELQNVIDMVNAFDQSVFKKKNNKKKLTKEIIKVLKEFDKGKYQKALDKLEDKVIIRLDGCTTTGTPDKNDYLINCDSQNVVYPILIDVSNLLKNLL